MPNLVKGHPGQRWWHQKWNKGQCLTLLVTVGTGIDGLKEQCSKTVAYTVECWLLWHLVGKPKLVWENQETVQDISLRAKVNQWHKINLRQATFGF